MSHQNRSPTADHHDNLSDSSDSTFRFFDTSSRDDSSYDDSESSRDSDSSSDDCDVSGALLQAPRIPVPDFVIEGHWQEGESEL